MRKLSQLIQNLFCITPDDAGESIRNIDYGSARESKPTSDIKTPSLFRSYLTQDVKFRKGKRQGSYLEAFLRAVIEEKLRFQNLLGL